MAYDSFSGMAEPYRRTQRGFFILLAGFLPLVAVVPMLASRGVPTASWILLALVSFLVMSFSWMTVTVDENAVRAKFGVGPAGRTVPISAIRKATIDELPALSGIGIRWLGGRDWLYNVSWGPVVRLILDDGRQVLIGSPEPEALLAAIEARRDVRARSRTA
jgi:hypothetical protein